MKIFHICYFTLLLIPLSCSDDLGLQRDELLKYIKNKGWNATETTEGVFVVVESEGTEDRPIDNSTVTLKYKAWYLDESVFDQSPADQNSRLKLSVAIPGLKIGLKLLGKNSKGIILIPSSLGYGNNPPFGIKNNSVLIYQVEVLDF
jgi:FKBP-type peptidyl-prolyl cis-trans isomerase